MSRGFAATLFAFVCWGFVPLFWRLLARVPVSELMAHRVVFCALFVTVFLVAREGASWLRPMRSDRRLAITLVATSVLVATNGGLYVYGVNSHQVVATSLGYFVNPLVNVVLGVVVLRETLTHAQKVAVGIATIGVAYLSYRAGSVPLLSLALAGTFGTYGLLRKTVAIDSVAGLCIESLLLVPFAAAFLVQTELSTGGAFGHAGTPTTLLLVASGIVTAVPLAAFAYGARQIPYSTVGIIQFVGPTLQLGCAVFVFHEPFDQHQLVGFGFIWSALALYVYDVVRRDRARSEAATSGALAENAS